MPDRATRSIHRAARILLVIASGMLVMHVLCAGLTVGLLTRPMRMAFAGDPQTSINLAYQQVTLAARADGVRLAAWYIPPPGDPPPDRQRVIVFVHGKDACKSCEFGARSMSFARAMHDQGFAVFMLDLRGHGESASAALTYGLRERNDVLGAVDWLLARGYRPGSIGLLGVSLGAASSLFAAAEEPAIGAVVSDSAYADIRSVFVNASDRMGGAPASILPVGAVLARWMTGEDILAASPIDQVARIAPRPVMIIHGAEDRLVPPAHALRLARAAGTQAWLIPGANHARTYTTAPEEYARRVGDFFSASLVPR
jgi:dipeptidyl aminopeptidase/acylaminoacyl peptidase